MTTAAPLLRLEGVSKSFGGVRALDGVDLRIDPGSVHGLLGQNGSGKSTLIKILAGYHDAETGNFQTPTEALDPKHLSTRGEGLLGMAFVHQDLGLVPELTVLENLRISSYGVRWFAPIGWSAQVRAVSDLLGRFDLEVDPWAPVASLTEVERALLAISRAVATVEEHGAGILVLDEPTVYLPRRDVDRLFSAVARISAAGHGTLFVTHRLDEVFRVCDTVTVLRDGRRVAGGPTDDFDERRLVHALVGSDLDALFPEVGKAPRQQQPCIRLQHVTGAGLLDVSLDIRPGELLGVTGLAGAGWERIPYVVAGVVEDTSGRIEIDGATIDLDGFTLRDARASGIGLIPANRLERALVADFTVGWNVTLLDVLDKPLLSRVPAGAANPDVAASLEEYTVAPSDPARLVRQLSGGNQQKVVLAKWLRQNPTVLVTHEPTQGVDVGARKTIYQLLRQLVEGGSGALVASAEYGALAELCDRVLVFRDGRVVAEVSRPALSEPALGAIVYGTDTTERNTE